jgi:hypothetical protein
MALLRAILDRAFKGELRVSNVTSNDNLICDETFPRQSCLMIVLIGCAILSVIG